MPIVLVKRDDIMSYEEVDGMIVKAESLEQKSLIAFLYLTGCRISEALVLKKQDIWEEDNRIIVRLLALKQKKSMALPTPFRHILKFSLESPFMDIILQQKEAIGIDQKFWNFNRFKAWRIVKKLNPNTYCHFFRHTRLTKLAEKGASDSQLKEWAGWTTSKMAERYVRRSPKLIEELADKVD